MHGWTTNNNRLCKTFTFKTFADAISFMVRVSYKAEDINHHPEWKNIYNKIHVELTTHDTGKITHLDQSLAAFMDDIFARMGNAQ